MAVAIAKPAPPNDDRRWKVVDARMRRLGYRPDALVEALHSAQDSFGYLDRDALAYVAGALRVAPSQVYGVATFYSYFTLEPQGAHTCVVCTGTACYINGAAKLLEAILAALGVAAAGQTTSDGQVSVLTAHCVGACSIAPVVVVDGDVHGKLSAEAIVQQLGEL
jgi:bidirectional [NiFe] hydrogenase diaphorase subunit